MRLSDKARSMMERGLHMAVPESKSRKDALDRLLEYCGPAFEEIANKAYAEGMRNADVTIRAEHEDACQKLDRIREILD